MNDHEPTTAHDTEPSRRRRLPITIGRAESPRRLVAVAITLPYVLLSHFWWGVVATWLVVSENPPPGWRRDRDAWQYDAIAWGNGSATAIAAVAFLVALVERRPVPKVLALSAPVAVAQVAAFLVLRTDGIPWS